MKLSTYRLSIGLFDFSFVRRILFDKSKNRFTETSKASVGSVFAVFILAAVFISQPVFANTVTVTNTNDSGAGSLRTAIAGALPGDTINFSLSYPATITLTGGELPIGKNLSIAGPGASSLAIIGNSSSRVFELGSNVTVGISGLTIKNGTAAGTSPAYLGGGIYVNANAQLTLANSTVSGNSAAYGGGIYSYYGTLSIINSTISGNVATNNGEPSGNGGGIYNYDGATTLTNSTISGNSAASGGGGIFSYNAPLTVINSTISGDSSTNPGGGIWSYGGPLTLKNSIVANHPLGNNCFASSGTLTSLGHNLSDDGSCSSFLNQTGDRNSTSAGLDPGGLQNNVGPTQTIALLPTSPAVNAIPVAACTDISSHPLATDQRGLARPYGAACDIGSFELTPGFNGQSFAYVANSSDNTVSVINMATNRVVATVPVGNSPFSLAITPDGTMAYVGNDTTVSVIDTATNTVVATLPVGGGSSNGIAFTPNGAFAYVVDSIGNVISVVDTATYTVVSTILVGANPNAVAITPSGSMAYVVNQGQGTVSVISTASNTVVATVPVPNCGFGYNGPGLTITPNGAFVYVSLPCGAASVIDTSNNQVVSTFSVSGTTGPGPSLTGIAFTPNGAFGYAALAGLAQIAKFDTTNTVVARLAAGNAPVWIAISANGAFAYVTNYNDNTVSVINTTSNSIVATVPVGTRPFGIGIARVLGFDDDSGFSALDGGNTFTGNQTINGTLTATALAGNGAGLTNVTAVTANNANFAANAAAIGGVAAGNIARRDAGNTFTGDQSVNGNVSAIAFAGDGSALTRVNALTAVSAVTAGSANFASDAATLHGIPAGNYARIDTGNAFTGDEVINGNVKATDITATNTLKIGDGTAIKKHLSMSFSVDFGFVPRGSCAASVILTLNGAGDGDTVGLGVPNSMMSAGTNALVYSAWVSAPDKITLRVCNFEGPKTPQTVTGSIRVDLWQY